jgi:aminobenzoyl-glutamate utilization protein B
MIRDEDRAEVNTVTEWVRDVAEGSAISTQTEVSVDLFFGMHDLMPNETLVGRIHAHMSALALEWTDEEQDFARGCQREMGLPEAGLAPTIMPPLPEITTGGATDVGDVSYNTPTALFALATMPLGVGLHTWPVTACGGMSIGDKSSLYSAIVMAGVGYDLMTDAELRAAARADFERRKGGRAYVSPLPEGKVRPEGIPQHLLLRDGHDELGVEFSEDARL